MSYVGNILNEWLSEQRHASAVSTHCVSPSLDDLDGFTVHVWTHLTDMQTAACVAVAAVRHMMIVSTPNFAHPRRITVVGFSHTCMAAASVAAVLHQSMSAMEWSVRCVLVAPCPNHVNAIWCLLPSVVHTITVVDDNDPMCEAENTSFDNSTEFIRLSAAAPRTLRRTSSSSPSSSLLNMCAIPRRSSSSSSGSGTPPVFSSVSQRVERYVAQLQCVTPRDVWRHTQV